jgi:2'-5' RNA ligase
MTDTVRTFVAIELPDEVKDALSVLIDKLNETSIRGIRTVRPEGIHLTLKFLGDVPKTQVESIVDAVTEAARSHPHFKLELSGVGAFPNESRPRVLWAGVAGDMESLNVLQKRVDNALAQPGFKKEKRGFNPHLTPARIRESTANPDRQRAIEVLSSTSVPDGLEIHAASVSLMRSTLNLDGAIYDCLASMPLLCDSSSFQS